jgi:serine/threonine-protein kinase
MSEFGAAQLPKPGDVIAGKYRLERIIGQGGMGAVFAARHIKLGHAVAIKVMLADRQNEEAARRFMNEGRASAHIENEHVVRIFDIDEERGYAYMVLELMQGEDLAQVLEEQGRLTPHVAVGYVMQALEGVRQAHALGIVHRDLKPSNLFLARLQNGTVVVKVLDFGISKARGASSLDMAPHQQTSTAAMLGSPLYMSPEQLRSSKNVDARADIWAMGVILYELLTGSVPFEGETLGALFSAIL